MHVKWLFGCLVGIAGACTAILVSVVGPEEKITGKWREVAWHYERVDDKPDSEGWLTSIDKQMQLEVNSHSVVHKAEIWEFDSAYNLLLTGQHTTDTAQWRIKGRGDVLHIQHPHSGSEEYQLKLLSPEKLELYFQSDLQVRGIIKIEFEKIN